MSDVLPAQALVRLFAVFTAVSAFVLYPKFITLKPLLYATAFTHYFFALWYGRGHVTQIFKKPTTLWPFLFLTAAGTALYIYKFPLVIYFGFHHAFNEVYLLDRVVPALRDRRWKMFRASAVLLNFIIYFTIVRNSGVLKGIPPVVVFLALGAALIFFAFCLFGLRRSLSLRTLLELTLFEAAGLIFVIVSLFTHIRFIQILWYHFLFWALFPVWNYLKQSEPDKLKNYLLLTSGVFAVFLAISPVGFIRNGFSVYQSQFYLWSYLHITFSFAMSNAHPAWVLKIFRPSQLEVS